MLATPYLNSSPPESPPEPLGRRFGRRLEEKGSPDLELSKNVTLAHFQISAIIGIFFFKLSFFMSKVNIK